MIGRDYKVVAVPGLLRTAECYGQHDALNLTVSYDPSQPKPQQQDTLLHEFIHAIDDAMVLGLTEEQTRAAATGLLAVLRDNPEFTKYLLS